MSRNNIIVIAVAIILIVLCIFIGAGKNNNETKINIDGKEVFKEVSYNTVTNEVTGANEYIVYDKETGAEKTRVTEECQLKIYELDPDYEELPVEKSEEDEEENIIENNDPIE